MLPANRTSRWLSLADIIVSRLHPWLIVQCTLHIGVKGMPSRELKYLVLTALIFIETMDDFQANNSERCLNVCDIHGVPSDGINTGWVGARSCSLALLPSSSARHCAGLMRPALIITAGSKSSIRRFVITEKAPTRA